MSTNNFPTVESPMSLEKREDDHPVETTATTHIDWLQLSIKAVQAATGLAEFVPFPYVQNVVESVVTLLETVEKMEKNREDLEDLCRDAVEITDILRDQISSDPDTAAVKLSSLCKELNSFLQEVVLALKKLQKGSHGFCGHLKQFIYSGSISGQIAGYQEHIRKLCSRIKLAASIDTNVQVHQIQKTLAAVITPNLLMLQVTAKTNTCPPPSRIFQGRQRILDKMHQFFTASTEEQHIYLLYGLGGSGKTQIGLKFIKESSSRFSNLFLIDASTVQTIETGFKNIAIAKRAGNSSNEGLLWLTSKVEDWLIFFDNADDRNLSLNDFIPQCDHGNVIITSRNPELRVLAGSHSLISDMDEEDAVALLFKSAVQEPSPHNQEIALDIVKTLGLFALAIIQAGAFISKSGTLDGYLDVYTKHQAQLLSERPAQSQDHYAWTVYTTWQISFAQLSNTAATFLQLCSFFHHQGISEQMFLDATKYEANPESYGPSEQELAKNSGIPLTFSWSNW
ncbi:FabD/lysophospholipase-like protein [Mycena venus]|uniref:FabD/lysophospholipase-like protein n=1 Tax=Mycena venus TaxID=2733690 RepID=A0A8H6X4P5_9AGAR|nr:FabD/lysophospholipase-like protein [Mycena venus]